MNANKKDKHPTFKVVNLIKHIGEQHLVNTVCEFDQTNHRYIFGIEGESLMAVSTNTDCTAEELYDTIEHGLNRMISLRLASSDD